MNKQKVIVIGASPNPRRYSYMAVKLLKRKGFYPIAIGIRKGEIDGIKIHKQTPVFNDVHTITLYINASRQKQYYDYILSLKPKRLIFNPGTENNELKNLLKLHGIQVVENCTLVMLHTNIF